MLLITAKIQKVMIVRVLSVHGVGTYQRILALQWLPMMTVPWSFTLLKVWKTPEEELSMQKVAYIKEDLLCETGFPLKHSDTRLV